MKRKIRHKFSVGDKVKVLDGSNIENYTGGWFEYMSKYVGKTYTITDVHEYLSGRVAYSVENSLLMFDERGLKLVENKVVITYVENMTIAKRYENGNCVKTGVAKCSPEDTFSEETGAKIALERLFAKSFDWESFKKGEIYVLCNKDNYKDFLKAAKEHNVKSKYKDTWDKLVLFDEIYKQIKMFCGTMSVYEEDLLPDDKAGFKVENGRITLMIFNPDKDDKVVEW